MPYLNGFDREQMMFCSWGDMVAEDSEARLVDAFVDSLDLPSMGFGEAAPKGRPAYAPNDLLKLYVWGYRKGIRSSRKLADACKTNVEAIWMLSGLAPDFRTVSDFRKAHAQDMRGVFHAFNERLAGAVEWGFASVDGSKFLASNAKDRNFTAHKLDDRISWLDSHMQDYLRQLDEMDALEEPTESDVVTRGIVEKRLAEAKERLERYEGYRRLLEETGASQISLTDADARLMKSKNGFAVAYNVQTAVDSNTHLIRDFEATNAPTDHGQLQPTMSRIARSEYGIAEVVADKGYQSAEDMVACLEEGILPHVILGDGQSSHELEVEYREAEGLDPESTDPAEISRCLHAGVAPEAYAGRISGLEVKTVRRKVAEAKSVPLEPYGTPEEMAERAAEGYFVRDPLRNLVVCPAGETLRQKSVKRSGAIRYANKLACKRCPFRERCLRGKQEWKEIDFTKDQLEKPSRPWHEAMGTAPDGAGVTKGHYSYEKVKVVSFRLTPDLAKTTQRMCLSEHPFGTIKRSMGEDHFLLRGLAKVEAEFSLMCLGYNIRRAAALLGFQRLMDLMVGEGACSQAVYSMLRSMLGMSAKTSKAAAA